MHKVFTVAATARPLKSVATAIAELHRLPTVIDFTAVGADKQLFHSIAGSATEQCDGDVLARLQLRPCAAAGVVEPNVPDAIGARPQLGRQRLPVVVTILR